MISTAPELIVINVDWRRLLWTAIIFMMIYIQRIYIFVEYVCVCVCVCVQFSVAVIQIGGKLQVVIGIWDCTHY